MGEEKIVVTGGSGFVGKHLAAELTQAKPNRKVIIWDRDTGVDITDVDSYIEQLKHDQPAWVVHLAAIASVPAAAKQPDLVHEVNVVATQKLLETIAAVSTHTKVLVASSADIYGQGSETPLAEMSLEEAHPKNPYAQSKWDMEKIIEEGFLDRVIRVRPFPHIGPGQGLGFVTADFASQIAAIESGKQEPILKVGNLEAKRDVTDVRDVVRAYRLLLEKGTIGEVYHVATGHAVPIQGMLDQLLALSTTDISVQEDPARLRPSDTPVIVGDAFKLKTATGWQPQIPLEQSLKDILNYWRFKQVKGIWKHKKKQIQKEYKKMRGEWG